MNDSVKVDVSSGSVDVEVFVRYNAVCRTSAGETQKSVELHFQTPRSWKKKFSISIHAVSPSAKYVQPLGSSIKLTPLLWTPSGRRGWDGKTSTVPLLAIMHVVLPLTVVERVPVHFMDGV